MSNLKDIVIELDKNIDKLGNSIISVKNNQDMKSVYIYYTEVITLIEELKYVMEFKEKEFIRYLKETKKRVDEINKKEVWYPLYYYIKNNS